tara:strand:- start:1127 stop:1558 length:432 start_codon:yes stop_codon:yes gene_type:complete
MGEIDVNILFNLFHSNDMDEASVGNYTNVTITPEYWLGMYKKLVLNHLNFKKKAIKFFKQSNMELDIEEVKKAGEFVAYNRAWFYISKINMKDKNHIEGIVSYGDVELETSLELSIKYFQSLEEYEKCAHLLEILEKSQEFNS